MKLNKHIAALCIGTFCLGVAELGIVPVLTDVAHSLHVSIPQAGLYISAYAAGVCAGIIGLLVFARSVNLKYTLLAAAVLILVGNASAALAQNDYMMLAARFISGSPHGIFFALGAVAAQRLAAEGESARDITLMVLGQTSANLVGVPLGSWIGYAFSWRIIFMTIAALSLLLIAALIYWLPSLPVQKKTLKELIQPLRHPHPWIILAGIAIGSGGFYAYYSYIDPIMSKVSGLPASMMTPVIALAGLSMFVGNVVSAPLTKHFNDETLVFSGQLLIAFAALGAYFLSRDEIASIFMMSLAAFGYFFIAGPMQALVIKGAGDAKVIIAALGQIAYNGANAIGAYLGGVAIDVSGIASECALPSLLLGFASSVLFYFVWRSSNRNDLAGD